MPEPINQLQETQSPFGPGLSEQLRVDLALTAETEDRVVVEIAGDIDRLDELLRKRPDTIKASTRVTALAQRVKALHQLYDILQERKDRLGAEGRVQIVATLVRKLRDTFKQLNTPAELAETVVMTLINNIETAEKDRETKRQRQIEQ